MYKYSNTDKKIISDRTKQFKNQVQRRLSGELSEEEFKPLRLMNGLYLQLHAYMLRVAIPYGELSSKQLKKLSFIADKYDKSYGHFTTRQNIQFNWPKLPEVPEILNELSKVEMHAIQTSGNCIRNISSDHLAGITNEYFCAHSCALILIAFRCQEPWPFVEFYQSTNLGSSRPMPKILFCFCVF